MGYAASVVLGVIWGFVDDWETSDAMAAALIGAGCMALVTTALVPRGTLGGLRRC